MRDPLRIALFVVAAALNPATASAGTSTSTEPEASAPPDGPVLVRTETFPVSPLLEPAVSFWYSIYAQYHSRQVVLHDPVYMDIVYVALDLSEVFDDARSTAEAQEIAADAIDSERERIAGVLRELADREEAGAVDFSAMTTEERRFYDAFARVEGGPEKYRDAADRIRAQRGLRDEFLRGIWDSAPYMPYMERSFRERGVPIELTRLVFVESMFNIKARSHVGAAGPYQFMSYTGRQMLRIDMEVDERYDPIRASEAAARLLDTNYRSLKSWPLAITAYNHGVRGMRRAINAVGTEDLGVIVRNYESRTFGFASRNFYAEFVAALAVYENRAAIFADNPELAKRLPLIWDEVVLPDYVVMDALIAHTNITAEDFHTYNPGLTRYVYSGQKYVPKGYPLRIPRGRGRAFAAAYKQIPTSARFKAQRRNTIHVVRRGQTLSHIARRYGVSISALMAWNHLHSRHRIYAGQKLRIVPRQAPPAKHADGTGEPQLRVVDVVKLPDDDAPPQIRQMQAWRLPVDDAEDGDALDAVLQGELSETDAMGGEASSDPATVAAAPARPETTPDADVRPIVEASTPVEETPSDEELDADSFGKRHQVADCHSPPFGLKIGCHRCGPGCTLDPYPF